MFKTIKSFFSLRRDDEADGILVMGVIFVPLFMICAGFAMDISKSVYVKDSFQSFTQEATTNAVRDINTRGGINESAVPTALNNYLAQTQGLSGSGDANQFGTAEVAGMTRRGSCTTVDVPNVGERQAPYASISIKSTRATNDAPLVTYTSNGGNTPVRTSGQYTGEGRVLEMVVWDSAPNIMLGMFGFPCQQIRTTVSSSTFVSQEDVENFYPNS